MFLDACHRSFGSIAYRQRIGLLLGVTLSFGGATLNCFAQEAPSFQQPSAPVERRSPPTQVPATRLPAANPASSTPLDDPDQNVTEVPARPSTIAFAKALYTDLLPPAELSFLTRFDGASSADLWRDKQFRQLVKAFVPSCEFHYGRDMPLKDALDLVLSGSRDPVQLRDGRYLVLSGAKGPYLAGRGMLWIDLQEGYALGAFYFTPTNGEPSPTLAIFSRQVNAPALNFGQLPPAFARDLDGWSRRSRVPGVITSYFLTADKHRVLLQHDQDFCSPANGVVGGPADSCEGMNADAADLDEAAADYLYQVNYATNATAWMIDPRQTAWLATRDRTCGAALNPFACRIRTSRARTVLILRRPRHR